MAALKRYIVHYTDAGQVFSLTIDAADDAAALDEAVARLKASDDWSEDHHRAWVGGVAGEAERNFRTLAGKRALRRAASRLFSTGSA